MTSAAYGTIDWTLADAIRECIREVKADLMFIVDSSTLHTPAVAVAKLKFGAPAAEVEELLRQLDSKDPGVRRRAALLIHASQPLAPALLDRVVKHLPDGDELVDQMLLSTVAGTGPKAARHVSFVLKLTLAGDAVKRACRAALPQVFADVPWETGDAIPRG